MQGGTSINNGTGATAPVHHDVAGAREVRAPGGLVGRGNVYAGDLGPGAAQRGWMARQAAKFSGTASATPERQPLIDGEAGNDDEETGPSKRAKYRRCCIYTTIAAVVIGSVLGGVCGTGHCTPHSGPVVQNALTAYGNSSFSTYAETATILPSIVVEGGNPDGQTQVLGTFYFNTAGAPNATFNIGPFTTILNETYRAASFNVTTGSPAEAQDVSRAATVSYPFGGAGQATALVNFAQGEEVTSTVNGTSVHLVPPAFVVSGQGNNGTFTGSETYYPLSDVSATGGLPTYGANIEVAVEALDASGQGCTVSSGGQEITVPAGQSNQVAPAGIQTTAELNSAVLGDGTAVTCAGNVSIAMQTTPLNNGGAGAAPAIYTLATHLQPPTPPTPTSTPTPPPVPSQSPTPEPSRTPSPSPVPAIGMNFTGSLGQVTCYKGVTCPVVTGANITGAGNGTIVWNLNAQLLDYPGTNSMSINSASGSALTTLTPADPSSSITVPETGVPAALSDIDGWLVTANQAANGTGYLLVYVQAYQPASEGQPALYSNIGMTNVTYNAATPPCNTPTVNPTSGSSPSGVNIPLMASTVFTYEGPRDVSFVYSPLGFTFAVPPLGFNCPPTTPGVCTRGNVDAAQLTQAAQGTIGAVSSSVPTSGQGVPLNFVFAPVGSCPQVTLTGAHRTRTPAKVSAFRNAAASSSAPMPFATEAAKAKPAPAPQAEALAL